MNNFNWLPASDLYKYSKEGALILALTNHEADTSYKPSTEKIILSPYLAHDQGNSHVIDGYHVLIFGGEYSEDDWEYGINFTIPNWWFLNDGSFEKPGNPVKFIPLLV